MSKACIFLRKQNIPICSSLQRIRKIRCNNTQHIPSFLSNTRCNTSQEIDIQTLQIYLDTPRGTACQTTLHQTLQKQSYTDVYVYVHITICSLPSKAALFKSQLPRYGLQKKWTPVGRNHGSRSELPGEGVGIPKGGRLHGFFIPLLFGPALSPLDRPHL